MFIISRRLCQKNIYQHLSVYSVTRHFKKRCYPVWPQKKFLIQDKIRKLQYLTLQKCDFRTTHSLRSSGICIFLGFILRISAFLIGRFVRIWWARKSEKEKEEHKDWFRERRNVILGCFGLYGLLLLIYYITHLEIEPLTKRSRFNIFDKEYEKYLGKIIFEDQIEMYKNYLLSETHPNYKRIQKVIKKLVTANSDIRSIRETNWTLSVINKSSPDVSYAYVIPGGHIFVALNALKIVENDDQLAFLLAHEIAHSLLLHSLEAISQKVLWDFLTVIPIFFIWSLLPDIKATVVHFLAEQIVNIIYKLPHRRILEREADDVGIKLTAKACFDIREAVVFWATLRTLTEMRILPRDLPWISSHPDHGDREKTLNTAMVKALELRNRSGCSVLPEIDPRDRFYKRSTTENKIYFRERGIIS
ncbi:metalloendopeptidase OMA1, mitochondrial-like [Pseudomyrmex gracilis]|uniref:metalloendopeptidase OMA1, mitochondrial-like n=1 Tax=Pseudomyrmex gracilis TaxID=219809 RepID=UPI0009954235|nr:metalloendopeptidase OMA1, mitochondrial-like [Pseudomyrmex gracilis]